MILRILLILPDQNVLIHLQAIYDLRIFRHFDREKYSRILYMIQNVLIAPDENMSQGAKCSNTFNLYTSQVITEVNMPQTLQKFYKKIFMYMTCWRVFKQSLKQKFYQKCQRLARKAVVLTSLSSQQILEKFWRQFLIETEGRMLRMKS